jgi:hypothetical protein
LSVAVFYNFGFLTTRNTSAVRQLPVEGAEVTVVYLGVTEPGVIAELHDDGRTVDVETLSGDRLRFRLNATGWFVTADRSARLQLRSA